MKKLSIIAMSIVFLLSCNQATTKEENLSEKDTIKSVESTMVSQPQSTDTTFTFESNEIDALPLGWSQYFTGKGDTTEWKILDDEGNKVLAQLSADNPNYHFNEIVFDGFEAKNADLEVKIKGVRGKMDQGGGFVWRFIDADNYYVVRANPLEDNVVLYKVENGKRTDLPLIDKGKTYGTEVEHLGSGWNVLKLAILDNIFTVYLNGKEIFRVKDETFVNAGKIGLWTKADAVTYFDDLQITNIK